MPEVVDKPLTARRAQTQERLMAAAVRMFAERGIIGASVEEICEAAGFTRGAFYSNFADKDELVLALIRKSIRTQFAAAEQAVARTMAAPTKLDTVDLVSFVLTAFVEFGTEDRETILVERELLLYAARQPALRAPYLVFVDECDRQLRALISDALAHAGLEFTVPFDEGLTLLKATWEHEQLNTLFGAESKWALMHTLLMAVTRPTKS
jgi:AcrR family transcriptional regulator